MTKTTVGRPAWVCSVLLSWMILILCSAEVESSSDGASSSEGGSSSALLDEVWRLTRDGFFDPGMNGLDWVAVGERYRARIEDDPSAWSTVANAMLAELETSHTRVYTDDDPAYFQLLGVFGDFIRDQHDTFYRERFGDGPVRYPGIGVFTTPDGAADAGAVVVTGVLQGLPAHEAGLRVGDVVLTANGAPFRPIASFRDAVATGVAVEMVVRRHADATPMTIRVTPRMLDAETLFVDAMRASAEVERHEGVEVAYIHAWSYSGSKYQDVLEEMVRFGGPLASADALVLDLRGGWGGASTEYLRLFASDIPVLAMRPRDGEWMAFDPQWRKPVVALIDGGTRSGKETLAWGFRHHAIGPLVGERTAGAVVGGRPHLLADGSLLYLAVADARVGGLDGDGERLEGNGVAPDITVPFEPRHAAGADPQRVRAVQEAAALARKPGARR